MKTIALAVVAIVLSSPAWAQGIPVAPALPTFFLPGTLSGADATLATRLDGSAASATVRATNNTTTGVGSIPMFTSGAGKVSSGAANILAPIGAPSP